MTPQGLVITTRDPEVVKCLKVIIWMLVVLGLCFSVYAARIVDRLERPMQIQVEQAPASQSEGYDA